MKKYTGHFPFFQILIFCFFFSFPYLGLFFVKIAFKPSALFFICRFIFIFFASCLFTLRCHFYFFMPFHFFYTQFVSYVSFSIVFFFCIYKLTLAHKYTYIFARNIVCIVLHYYRFYVLLSVLLHVFSR